MPLVLHPTWRGRVKSTWFQSADSMRAVASFAVERAWTGSGVRIYRWPCGTCCVVRVHSREDRVLLRDCDSCLLMTCTRGITLAHVVDTLRWAARRQL